MNTAKHALTAALETVEEQEATIARLKLALYHIIMEINEFDMECEENGSTDTCQAWVTLGALRSEAIATIKETDE